MGYNIYYMYDITKGVGYIGQNTKDKDDSRIIDHYNASITPKTKIKKGKNGKPDEVKTLYDGGAELIKDADKLSNIRYKIFNDSTYGISENIYNEFLKEWSLDPLGKEQTWNDLTSDQKLDLAEIMHVVWAHLTNTEWNKYNRLIGGMSYTKDNQDAMESLTYRFTDEGLKLLKETYLEMGIQEAPVDYKLTRFSIQKTPNRDDFSKLVYPIKYLISKGFVQKRILEILQEWFAGFFKKLFERTWENKKFKAEVESQLGIAAAKVWMIPETWSSLLKDASGSHAKVKLKSSSGLSNRKVVDKVVKSFTAAISQKTVDDLQKKLNFAIRKMIRGVELNWDWQLDKAQVYALIKRMFTKMEKMSIASLSKVFEFKYNNLHLDLDGIITIPHRMIINIEEKYTTLPTWALNLKRLNLLSNWKSPESGKLKIEICKGVCGELFNQIQTLIKPNQYDTTKTLQMRLYNQLQTDDWIYSGYSWDFCRTLIEIWHEYTYGSDAWIRMGQTAFFNPKNDPAYMKYHFARKDVVEKAKTPEDAKKIHWYQGAFIQSSGINKGSIQSAAEALAKNWKW